ncbi:MAG: hypothetical protein LOD91_11125, partial [Limnochordales bacterium]
GLMGATALGFYLFPEPLARAFSPEEAVVPTAVTLLGVAAFFQLFDGNQALMSGALRGAGEDQAYTSSIHIKHTSYWPLGHQLPGFGRGAPAKAAAWFTAAKQIAKSKQLC